MSARPMRTISQEGEKTADGSESGAASADVVDVHIPMTLTRAGQYRLTVEIRNTDGQVRNVTISLHTGTLPHSWSVAMLVLLLPLSVHLGHMR